MTPYLAMWRVIDEKLIIYQMVFVTSPPNLGGYVSARMMEGKFYDTVPVPVAELVGID